MEASTSGGTSTDLPQLPEGEAINFFSELPPELLSHIFELATIPEYLLDHAISRGPTSDWCQDLRLRKGLLLVCKLWNQTALPILYRYIVIRRVGQVVVLSRTLEDNPERIGNLVHSIVIEGFIPRGYLKLFSQRVEVILGRCPVLRYLSANVLLPHPTSAVDIPVNENITHLTLGGDATYENVSQILNDLCDRLTYLSIRVTSGDPELSYSFPKLKTIIGHLDPRATTHHTFKWTMPSLSAITVNILGGETPHCISACASFCKLHGRHVKSLSIRSGYGPAQRIPMQTVISCCPSIEYLQASSGMIRTLSHPHVKHIDIGDNSAFPYGPQASPIVPSLPHYDWDCPAVSRVRVFTGDLLLMEGLTSSLPLDFKRSPVRPLAGIPFENLCICHTNLGNPENPHCREVQFIHPIGDHRPTNLGKGVDFPDPAEKKWEAGSEGTESSECDEDSGDSDEDVSSAVSTVSSLNEGTEQYSGCAQLEQSARQMPWPPDADHALDLFRSTLDIGSTSNRLPEEGDQHQHWWSFLDSEANSWEDEDSTHSPS